MSFKNTGKNRGKIHQAYHYMYSRLFQRSSCYVSERQRSEASDIYVVNLQIQVVNLQIQAALSFATVFYFSLFSLKELKSGVRQGDNNSKKIPNPPATTVNLH